MIKRPAEVIVSALAECDPPTASDNNYESPQGTYCLLCFGRGPYSQPEGHAATCPWRMAREYIGASAPFR